MQRSQLGTSELMVSRICYGGGGFGSSCRGRELAARIDEYRAAGGNFLDTAHCYAFWTPYGAGCSEQAIGEYVRSNGRGDLVVATKGGHPAAPGYEREDAYLSPDQVAADIDDSLKNLGLDVLDLYWLHRDDTRLAPGEIVEALNVEVARGRIRYFGASNWHHTRLAEARTYAAEHGLHGFVASQPEWNLADKKSSQPDEPGTGAEMRALSASDLAWHRRSRMPVVPYSASAGGFFASAGRSGAQYDTRTSRERQERVAELSARRGISPGQLALAWLINQDIPVFPIIGTLNSAHLADALAAADLSLCAAELLWLSNGSGPDRSKLT